MSGVIRQRNTRTRESSSRISRLRTGRGIRWRRPYYWHRFYSHQPDLNFDNPAVHEAVQKVLDFWLGMGVDGLRLDAIPYLYEREGTNCENLPETHEYLKKLRAHVEAKFPDACFSPRPTSGRRTRSNISGGR